MQPGDRLIVGFLSPEKSSSQFKKWPLHITLVPWFRSDVGSDELAKQIRKALKEVKPFTIKVGNISRLGRGKEVNLIKLPSELTSVEQLIRKVIKNQSKWIVDETTKKPRTFLPHVTVQGSNRVNMNDNFLFDKVYVVKQLGQAKQIDEVVKLADEQ